MDDHGVDSLPVALASSLIILALIASLAAIGLRNAQPMVSTASVDSQISTLSNDCNAMLASSPRDLLDPASPPGASKTIRLSLPEDTEYVAFGIDPDADNVSEGTIYYKVHGNKKAVIVDRAVKFREGDVKGNVVTPSQRHRVISGGGRQQLTLEYEYDRAFGEKYIVIY